MDSKLDIVLSLDEIDYLGGLYAGRTTPISPLNITGKPVKLKDDRSKNRLVELGLVTPDGTITAEGHSTFSVLAGARAYAGVDYFGSGLDFDFMVYFDDGHAVSMVNTAEGVRIVDPAPTETMLELLSQRIGISAFSCADLDTVLTVNESLVLMALVDLRRRQLLGALLDRNSAEATAIPESAVAGWLTIDNQYLQWLTPYLKAYLDHKRPLAPESVSFALKSLAGKGFLEGGKEPYLPGDMVDTLASTFLLLNNLLIVQAGRMIDNKDHIVIQFEVFQAGISELLLWETAGIGKVRLLCPSSAQLMVLLSDLLSNYEALQGLEGMTLAEQRSVIAASDATLTTSGWRLTIANGPNAGQSFALGDRVRLGRGADNEIRLANSRVSRHHAILERVGQGYLITDQGSSNGTYVNGVRISQPTPLHSGDTITIGDTQFTILGEKVAADRIEETIVCPACGAWIASRKFCTQCGVPLG